MIRPGITYREIRQAFVGAKVSDALVKRLEFFVEQIRKAHCGKIIQFVRGFSHTTLCRRF